ncbi:hypothetical protein DAETH_22180 [Deinococcus aetherius]|uniref:Uncharacterized protein n=1 Tax=Deinococcus aetherius TaxID=200252 RepID=A0ABN6RHX7_9DEIO|nr:hypothetical protein [Deinococcus aetherius]BDP42249.1 hypothetical protein DAETH_22180 [Deinococcus aetherius]
MTKARIEQEFDFQRREWRVERIGWGVIWLLLALALAGLFGGGPLSRTSVSSGDLTLDFPRFERETRPTELEVSLPLSPDGQGQVWIANDTLERLQVQEITPPPMRIQNGPKRTEYLFRGEGDELRVTFDVEFQRAGVLRGHLGQVGGLGLNFSALVYP